MDIGKLPSDRSVFAKLAKIQGNLTAGIPKREKELRPNPKDAFEIRGNLLTFLRVTLAKRSADAVCRPADSFLVSSPTILGRCGRGQL